MSQSGSKGQPASRGEAFPRFICVVALLLLVVACSTGRKIRSAFGGQLPVEVTIDVAANEGSPVAVDLLVVYDEKLVEGLLAMPAAEWFSKKQQYVADHPAVTVQGWEWVPGQSVEPFKIPYRAGARSVVLFADYISEGEHRAVVGRPKPFRIILGERDLSIEVPQ
jgi:type VI secretion system protein